MPYKTPKSPKYKTVQKKEITRQDGLLPYQVKRMGAEGPKKSMPQRKMVQQRTITKKVRPRKGPGRG